MKGNNDIKFMNNKRGKILRVYHSKLLLNLSELKNKIATPSKNRSKALNTNLQSQSLRITPRIIH